MTTYIKHTTTHMAAVESDEDLAGYLRAGWVEATPAEVEEWHRSDPYQGRFGHYQDKRTLPPTDAPSRPAKDGHLQP